MYFELSYSSEVQHYFAQSEPRAVGDFLTGELCLWDALKLMVYTKCLVFLPFCGGCCKYSLLCPKWDLGGEMITGEEHSSMNSQQKSGRSMEPFKVCQPKRPGCQLFFRWAHTWVWVRMEEVLESTRGRWVVVSSTGLRSGCALTCCWDRYPRFTCGITPKPQRCSSLWSSWMYQKFVPRVSGL